MRAHIIEGGVVTNTIEVETLDLLPNLVVSSPGVGIGWLYKDGVFTEPPAALEALPESISMRQCRLQLLEMGVLSSVNTSISTMPEAAQIEWEYGTEIRLDNPLILPMSELLSWTKEDIDNYFLAAKKL